jgi:hypothetical protein
MDPGSHPIVDGEDVQPALPRHARRAILVCLRFRLQLIEGRL